jgi:large subunit ribosomal protein L6
MSRIGKQPIPIPSGVSVDSKSDHSVTVKGPGGTLTIALRPEVEVEVNGSEATVTLNGSGAPRQARAFHGMTRALIGNMVTGVHTAFLKKLEIHGVGWNVKVQGKQVVLNIGFCHPVNFILPDGIVAECANPTSIQISGADKQAVGQFAAEIRAVRPPEPYKGKGIRYQGEYVRRKAGKSFGA